MLDSLVRVSRRVGGVTDILATEALADLKGNGPTQEKVTATIKGERGLTAQPKPNSQTLNTAHPKRDSDYLVAYGSREVHRKQARKRRAEKAAGQQADPPRKNHPGNNLSRLNLHSQLRESPPFTTKQFHVLLNSLFKVLFNFPSRYLFAIGLGVIFSLTWSLPRALGCTPKQPDSRMTHVTSRQPSNGTVTLFGASVRRT